MWNTTKNHTPAQNFDPIEQTYKVDEFEVLDPTSLENLLTDEFLNNAMQRFKSMHEDLAKALQEI